MHVTPRRESSRARRIARLIVAAGILSLVPARARAAAPVQCVKPGGADGCHASIQAAIDASASLGATVSSGVVEVHPGTYAESLAIPPHTALTIRGVGAASEQVVDGSGSPDEPTVLALQTERNGRPARLTLERLSLTGGRDGAVVYGRSQLIVKQCRIHHNRNNGLAVYPDAEARVSDTEIFLNFSTGLAIYSHARAIVDRTTIRDNITPSVAGGITLFGGRLELSNSTISGNQAARGGGIGLSLFSPDFPTFPRVRIRFSTIAANRADKGGGIALFERTSNRIDLEGVLLADNQAEFDADCSAAFEQIRFIDRGSSLIESTGSCGFAPHPTSLYGVDPLLGPLADNGGPARTHALLPGSPAEGAARRGCPTTDERGVPRGRPCSIGAVE